MNKNFGKIITAMVTPFNKELNVDLAAIKSLVLHLEQSGTNTLVLSGTTGEGPTITEQEKMELLNEVCKHKSSATKIIMNVGTNNTKETVGNAIFWSNNDKVDGIMVVCPYYNKPSQIGLYKHFKSVNDAVGKPIMAYHIPGRTNVTMTAETMINVANLSNIVMLKDAEGDMEKLKFVISETKNLWDVYCGDDPALLDYLEIGSKGVVSVASHIVGDAVKDIIDGYAEGAKDETKEIQEFVKIVSDQLFPPFAPNPVSVKFILSHLELMNEYVRLPLTEMDKNEKNVIITQLKELIAIQVKSRYF